MAVRILYLVVVSLFVPGLVYAQRNIDKMVGAGKTVKNLLQGSGQIAGEMGKSVPAISTGVIQAQVKAVTNAAGVSPVTGPVGDVTPILNRGQQVVTLPSSNLTAETARRRSITPIDYTLKEKETFPLFLETLIKKSLFRSHSFLQTSSLNVMRSLFDAFPDKDLPLAQLLKQIGVQNSEIWLAAKNHPKVIAFLDNPHSDYESINEGELPAFIEPLFRATFPRHRHGGIEEKPVAFMGQLFKSFPEYQIPLIKVFLSRGATGVEILEAAEHDKEVAKFLFSYPGIVEKALQKRQVVEVSRPDDYLFSYKQLHFMQTGLEVNPDRVMKLLNVFARQGAPREELLYISVAYPKIVESMLYEPLSENVKSSIAWNALKYNYQETALLFATDNKAIAMLGAYAALLEKWDFMERLLREYPQVTPEDMFQALLDRRPLPWAGNDYPSYYEPSWSDLYNHEEKRHAITALAERYGIDLVARGVDLNCY